MPSAVKVMNVDFGLLMNTATDISTLKSSAVDYILDGQLSVVALIQHLGPFLTSEDEAKRVEGSTLLVQVLEGLPSGFLSPVEVNVMAVFFCDRIKDHYTVTPMALRGVLVVLSMTNFPRHLVLDILSQLTLHVTCQTLNRAARHTYYEVLQMLMTCGKDELLTKSSDFVYACISAMDSEGDPRNLMLLFQFLPEVFTNFSFKHLAEEAFSVLECYFPIDFNARENMGITREDLARGLEHCLTASIEFGPFAIPMIFEKLESALKIAHVDSLKLLIKGLNMWSVDDINPHMNDLWKSIKAIVLPSNDAELSDLATKALIALFYKYETSPINKQQADSLQQLLRDITASTHAFLADPMLSLFLASTKLLAGISLVSSTACDHVVKTVTGQFTALLNQKSASDIVLQALAPILKATVHHCCWNRGSTKEILEEIPTVLVNHLRSPRSQNGAFTCLHEIISVLNPETRRLIYATLLEICKNQTTDDESFRKFVTSLAEVHTEEVLEFLLSKLSIRETGNSMEMKKKIEILSWCVSVKSLVQFASNELMGLMPHEKTSSIAVLCLRDLCEKSASETVLHSLGADCHLVVRLLEVFLAQKSNPPTADLVHVSKIIEFIVRTLDSCEQSDLCRKTIGLFTQFSDDSTPVTTQQIVLLNGLWIPLRQNVTVDTGKLVPKLISTSLIDDNKLNQTTALILLASIINKHQIESELQSILVKSLQIIDESLTGSNSSTVVPLLIWITKSLILRGHRQADFWLDKLIELLDDGDRQMEAADGFNVILSDYDELSIKNYCVYRLLFKQRIFSKIKKLISFLDKNEKSKTAVSMAIAHVLRNVPRSLVLGELEELIRVMVICMESQDHRVSSCILEVVSTLLASNQPVFEDYVETFVPRCLACCSSPNMDVRMWALNCLYFYGKFPTSKILNYRDMVLSGIQPVLDDKKRLVRQKAVRARTRWFLVGSKED